MSAQSFYRKLNDWRAQKLESFQLLDVEGSGAQQKRRKDITKKELELLDSVLFVFKQECPEVKDEEIRP